MKSSSRSNPVVAGTRLEVVLVPVAVVDEELEMTGVSARALELDVAEVEDVVTKVEGVVVVEEPIEDEGIESDGICELETAGVVDAVKVTDTIPERVVLGKAMMF